DHEHLALGHLISKFCGCFQSAQTRHADVEQYQIGLQFSCFLHTSAAVCRLTAHFQAFLTHQERDKTAPYEFVVVCDQYSHAIKLGARTSTHTTHSAGEDNQQHIPRCVAS